MADIYIKPTPSSIGAATAAQGAKADTAVQDVASAYMPSFSSIDVASGKNLSVYSEVQIRRWSASSVLAPVVYKKVGSDPGHLMAFADVVGNWWEIAPDTVLSPYHAGCVGSGDETAKVQNVIDLAQTRGCQFDGSGPDWPVSKINISTGNVYFEIIGMFKLKGVSNAAQTCLLEITRGNFSVNGSITAFCQWKTNYAAGIWVHNNTQIQSADLQELIAVGCLVGIRIGDTAFGASVTSEITLSTPRTYGCPTAIIVEGGNTYITIIGPSPLSADGFGGDLAWNALTKRGLINKGATTAFIGGELIQTGSGLATDWLVEMQPCMFNTDIAWGRVILDTVALETGGPLCTVTNPLSLTGTALANDKPAFSVRGCIGYHSQDNSPFISTVSAYPGEIVIDKVNFWYPGGTRTQPNISCAGTLCNVWVDDHGFGNGFKGAISGTVGGTVHFSKRVIYEAIGLPSSPLASGSNLLKFQSFSSSDDNLRFQPLYSASTGVFTTIELRNFRVRAQAYASGVTGSMVILDNGTEVARSYFADGGSVMWEAINIAAGRSISVVLLVASGAGASPSTAAFLNMLVIEALN